MAKFDSQESQLARIKNLMTYGMVSESDNHNVKCMEYTAVAADGNTYGIIRECNKYYIKVAKPGKEKIAEGYDYVGGYMNKNEHEYSSYANALKQFELKLKSINEAYDVKVNIETLDPYRKEDLVIEGTQKMKDEIARQRQIMNHVCALMNESATIGMNNTGNPEAPKTSGLDIAKSAPFEDKAEAKLDTDLKASANNPESQGEPFEDKAEAKLDGDLKTTSESPEKQGEPFGEKAQYVPNNSVADKKPAGGKVVRVNESVEDDEEYDGELLLDDETEEEIPEIIDSEEEMTDVEGEDVPEMDGEEMSVEDDEMPEDNDEEFEDDDEDFDFDFEEFEDDDMVDTETEEEDIMAKIARLEAELAELKGEVCGEDGCDEDEEIIDLTDEEEIPETDDEEDIESEEMPEEEDVVDEARTSGAVAKPSDLSNELYRFPKDYERMKEIYQSFIDDNVSPEEAESLYQEADNCAAKLMSYYKDNAKVVKGVEKLNSSIFDAFDELVGGEMDNKFDAKNDEYNAEKDAMDDPDASYNPDKDFDVNTDAAEKDFVKTLSNESFNQLINDIIKEEITKLNVFGKHPGYRKKPMNLPPTGSDDFQGNKDWNDESVRSEEPFGSKIGDSAPFDKVVAKISESVLNTIKKKL